MFNIADLQLDKLCGGQKLTVVWYLFVVVGEPLQQALLLLHFQVGASLFVSEGLLTLFLCLRQVKNLCLAYTVAINS